MPMDETIVSTIVRHSSIPSSLQFVSQSEASSSTKLPTYARHIFLFKPLLRHFVTFIPYVIFIFGILHFWHSFVRLHLTVICQDNSQLPSMYTSTSDGMLIFLSKLSSTIILQTGDFDMHVLLACTSFTMRSHSSLPSFSQWTAMTPSDIYTGASLMVKTFQDPAASTWTHGPLVAIAILPKRT